MFAVTSTASAPAVQARTARPGATVCLIAFDHGERLADGHITDARHEADLVVDEYERSVVGRQRLIRAIATKHDFLLL